MPDIIPAFANARYVATSVEGLTALHMSPTQERFSDCKKNGIYFSWSFKGWFMFYPTCALDNSPSPFETGHREPGCHKIYLSVLPEDIAKATNALLVDVATECLRMKSATTHMLPHLVDEQKGKVIVIYLGTLDRYSVEEWTRCIQKFEDTLINAGIRPDTEGRSDSLKPIRGSKYISFRRERAGKEYEISGTVDTPHCKLHEVALDCLRGR